jgi:hypothetical protein
MTVTLTHRTGQKVVKKHIVKFTQDEDYITLYFDRNLHPTMVYTKLPVKAYGMDGIYKISKVEV